MTGPGRVSIVLLALAISPVATAQPAVHVDIHGDCPTSAAVASSLTRLLPNLRLLWGGIRLTVEDHGANYRVQVDRSVRVFSDPARDCEERARVAAIFGTAVIAPPVVNLPGSPSDSNQAAGTPRRWFVPDFRLELAGIFDAAPRTSPNNSLLSGGGGVRLFIGTRHWGGVLGIAALSAVTLDLPDAKARVVRVALDLSARGHLRRGRWEPSLDVGIAVVPFFAQGLALDTNKKGASAEVGVRISPQLSCWFTRRVAAFLAAQAVIVPVPQNLRVESVGVVGTMPYAWLAVSAGLAVELR